MPVMGQINLGVLKKTRSSGGHEPLLPEIIVDVVQDPELQKAAKAVGAKGINIAGMCCSANEILMASRHSVGGNFLQQELAIVTGLSMPWWSTSSARCSLWHRWPSAITPS